jgi:hypothetical protein
VSGEAPRARAPAPGVPAPSLPGRGPPSRRSGPTGRSSMRCGRARSAGASGGCCHGLALVIMGLVYYHGFVLLLWIYFMRVFCRELHTLKLYLSGLAATRFCFLSVFSDFQYAVWLGEVRRRYGLAGIEFISNFMLFHMYWRRARGVYPDWRLVVFSWVVSRDFY